MFSPPDPKGRFVFSFFPVLKTFLKRNEKRFLKFRFFSSGQKSQTVFSPFFPFF